MKHIVSILALILFFPVLVEAELSQQQIAEITETIHEATGSWSIEDTRELLRDAKSGPVFITLGTTKGNTLIEVKGETILLNGKDITGNLGSKTTYGDNSPIIEEVQSSQITTGDKSPIKTVRTTSIKICVYLSLVLTISLGFNIAFVMRLKKQRAANKALKATR